INSLLDEFAGELILLKLIPPGIDKVDCDPEDEILLIENFFDSLRDEIELSFTSNNSMPPGIEDDDYDSEGDILEELLSNDSLLLPENESFHFDIPSSLRLLAKPPDDDEIEPNLGILTVKMRLVSGLTDLWFQEPLDDDYDSEGDILEELLSNDSLLLPENESFHFDIPSSLRLLAKPPDDDEIEPNLGILTVKMVSDISKHYVPIPRLFPTQPTHASNKEKSPHLLSYRGLKLFSFLLKAR
nr:hypothetical protein [Tanacetum cinerariifolium]